MALGEEGPFYSPSPKTSRWGLFRPETPAQVTGASGLAGLVEGRRFRSLGPETPAWPETPGTLRGCSGPTPERHHTDAKQPRKPGAGDSGSSGRRLRTISGVSPDRVQRGTTANTKRQRNQGAGDSGSQGRRFRYAGDSGPSPG